MIDLDSLQTALNTILTTIISFTPKLLTAIIILGIGWLVAKLFSRLTQKLAEKIQLNRLVEKAGLAEGLKQAQISQSPSDLLGLFIFWLIFLNILVMAFEALGLATAVEQLQAFIAYLPQILAALLVLIAGSLLAQFLGRVTQAGVASLGLEFHQAIGQTVKSLLLVLVIIVAVGQLGVNTTILTDTFTSLLTIAAAGLALAFGLGGREVTRNVLAGHYAREVFMPGDMVTIDNYEGTIEAIGTLNTEILVDEHRVVLPNVRLTEGQVKIRPVHQS